MPKNNLLGIRIRDLRNMKGVNQAEVASAIGLGNHTVLSNLERGANLPSLPTAILLADYFGVSLDYLTGRSDGDPEMQRRASVLAQIEELRSQL